MGREVRMVPKDWEHPKRRDGNYEPQWDRSYKEAAEEFLAMANEEGLQEALDYFNCPDKKDFMPDWGKEERTHLMMYEDTTEGTPISPAFETPEELAKWLSDSGASAFGSSTASYEEWLRVCKGGYAPSAVVIDGEVKSGVEGL